MTLVLDDARMVGQELQRDIAHHLGLAVHVDTGRQSWAHAVVEPATGTTLAWDGWYYEDLPSTPPLTELPWHDHDDMPSKLLLNSNGAWLGGPLCYQLMPSYSLERLAASIITSNADSHSADDRTFHGTTLVAYFPIADVHWVIEAIDKYPFEYQPAGVQTVRQRLLAIATPGT